jgi:inward rectifier potassium channel
MTTPRSADTSEDLKDLGLGTQVTDETRFRLLNRDGTFNVTRRGLPFLQSVRFFHVLLTAPWWVFYLSVIGLYLGTSLVFAIGFVLSGPGAIEGATGTTPGARFGDAFFFSVQTITTVGYGHLIPRGLASNVLVTFEAFLGLAGVAVAAGVIYARVSRPTANILFSHKGVVGPYQGGSAFMFRIANGGRNELVDVGVRIVFSKTENVAGRRRRQFHELDTERRKLAFFPLSWTVVHPITESSPLHAMSLQQLCWCDAEFLVFINAVDETFSDPVHARSSYKWNELEWDARFSDMFRRDASGQVSVDLRKLHDIEQIEQVRDLSSTLWDMG